MTYLLQHVSVKSQHIPQHAPKAGSQRVPSLGEETSEAATAPLERERRWQRHGEGHVRGLHGNLQLLEEGHHVGISDLPGAKCRWYNEVEADQDRMLARSS